MVSKQAPQLHTGKWGKETTNRGIWTKGSSTNVPPVLNTRGTHTEELLFTLIKWQFLVNHQSIVRLLWLAEQSPSSLMRKQIWCMKAVWGETQSKIYQNNNRRIYCAYEQKPKLLGFGIRKQKKAALCKNSVVWEWQVLEIEIVFPVVNFRETLHLKKRTFWKSFKLNIYIYVHH